MKKLNLIAFFVLGIVASTFSQHNFNNAPSLPSARNGFKWDLNEDLSTDFSSFSDMDKGWVREYPRCGGGNPWSGPGQTNFTTENAGIKSGILELVATNGGFMKSDAAGPDPSVKAPAINTGIISSRKTVKYPVYMEARIQAANMLASSNFWGISDDQTKEIDVLEVYGGGEATDEYIDWFTYRAASNFHIFTRSGTGCGAGIALDFHDQKRKAITGERWREKYHTFGVLWRSPTDVQFFYDGVVSNDQSLANSNPFIHNPDGSPGRIIGTQGGDPNKAIDQPIRLIIDLEIHDWLSFGRNSDGRNIRPDLNSYEFGGGNNIMKVDWVRVYNEVNSGGNNNSGSTSNNSSNSGNTSNSGSDLAAGKNAFQSSTYQNNTNRFGAGKVVDNNGSTFNHTNSQNNPWWEVDLGSSKNIGQVKIWNRGDCCQNRLNNFDIKIYDRRGGNQIKSTYVSGQPSNNGSSYNINATGRVVRVQLRGNNRILHMDQLQVLAGSNTTNTNNNTASNNNDTPIGKVISLRKSGGDRKYISAVTELNNDLYANQNSVQGDRQKFRIDAHPNGGVALYSLSARKYVQVNNKNQNIIARARGNAANAWERFEWKNKGSNKVALKSLHSGKWLQASHSQANAAIFPKGAADRNWETFEWKVEANKSISNINQKKEAIVYPNPVNNGDDFTISGINLGDTIRVISSNGQIIKEIFATNKSEILNSSNLTTGLYFVQINNDQSIKLIVK